VVKLSNMSAEDKNAKKGAEKSAHPAKKDRASGATAAHQPPRPPSPKDGGKGKKKKKVPHPPPVKTLAASNCSVIISEIVDNPPTSVTSGELVVVSNFSDLAAATQVGPNAAPVPITGGQNAIEPDRVSTSSRAGVEFNGTIREVPTGESNGVKDRVGSSAAVETQPGQGENAGNKESGGARPKLPTPGLVNASWVSQMSEESRLENRRSRPPGAVDPDSDENNLDCESEQGSRTQRVGCHLEAENDRSRIRESAQDSLPEVLPERPNNGWRFRSPKADPPPDLESFDFSFESPEILAVKDGPVIPSGGMHAFAHSQRVIEACL